MYILQLLLKDFAEISQNAYREKYTFQWHLSEIYGYFSLAEIQQTISFSMLQTKN